MFFVYGVGSLILRSLGSLGCFGVKDGALFNIIYFREDFDIF